MKNQSSKIKISEQAFSTCVEDLLKLYQWRWYHARPARIKVKGGETYRTPMSGHKGLPDYIAVRPPRLLFIELKDQYAKPSPEQEEWLEDLKQCHIFVDSNKSGDAIFMPEVYLFRPNQLETEIMDILK